MTERLAFLGLTYLVAAIPFGVVVTTLFGAEADIRTAGSGNIGATNVARVYSWRLAGPVLLFDLGKGFVPVLAARYLLGPGLLWPALIAAAAFVGHCYPVFLEFRGGKGVATGAGSLLALSPLPTVLAFSLWGGLLAVTGRSSVAALGAAIALVLLVWQLDPHVAGVAGLLAVGVIITHIANIGRLWRGEEKQVIAPVRWGKRDAEGPTPDQLLAQAPTGASLPPALWRDDTQGESE